MIYDKLPPHIKAAWVAALRSGKYAQAQGRLREWGKPAYCCLGVLCDIGDRKAWKLDKTRWLYEAPDGSQESGSLPVLLNRIIGLSIDAETYLIEMNDEGKSFCEIADWIEENL